MKKRDKLYTVNKWNKNQFCKGGNLFPDGGPLVPSPTPLYIPGVDLPKTVPGISVPKPSGSMLSGIGGGALGAAGSLVNTLGSKLISDGYSTGGVGEGIAGVGNAAGQIVGQFNPIAGAIVSAASGIVGGVVNRGFGTKKNDKNINIIQTNTADARNAGNLLASSSTSDALLSNAGSMTTSSDFGTRDLVKGGWFAKGKAARQGQKFIDAENNALAYQNHGLATGAEKVDNNLDSTAQSNFIYATGGPLGSLTKPGIKTFIEEAKKTSAERTAPDWINWNLNDIADAITSKGKKKKGKFGKGKFGGSGAGGPIEDPLLPYEVTKRDTLWLPIEDTFNDAFARARKAGLKEFEFNGKRYNTELGDNPANYEAGQRRTQVAGILPLPFERTEKGMKKASEMNEEEFNAAMAEREAELRAFGGPLDYITDNDMGAINYSFMTDYLTTKKKQAEANNKMPGISPTTNVFAEGGIEIKHPGRLTRLKERTGKTEAELYNDGNPAHKKMVVFARNSRKWAKALGGQIHRDGVTVPDNVFCGGGKMFALGGDIQTNGADFTNGMQHINAGNSHEENPYEGVQVGVDPQGVPNLVEENEVIFNDYVYSDRIQIDDATKEKFRISKKREMSYANLAKKLEKESLERPNDPISKAALKKQMEELANQQERQKQEMEAQRAQEAFNALSPEEQVAVMQQASQQEQIAQEQSAEQAAEQQAMQEQQVSEEAMAQQPMTPEEAQQQQIMAQQMAAEQAAVNPEDVNISAEGGKLNKFPNGGKKNAGTWKKGNSSTNWNAYTRQGLVDYLNGIVSRINDAKTDKEKDAIRQEAIKTVYDIQNAYKNAYQTNITPSEESEAVRTLQTLFQNAGGNAYFNNIADNINLPAGHNTLDTQKGGWIDALWGPRTSIRNWGATEYGDAGYYKDIADLAAQAGLTYAPNADLTYGDNNQLYTLTLANNAGVPSTATPPIVAPWNSGQDLINAAGNNTQDTPAPIAAAKDWKAQDAGNISTTGDIAPVHRAEWPRYVGLFGPAVGLGMQALGIGRPNTKAFDAVLEGYDRRGAATADYRTIGDYLRYTPMDIWAEQNRMNASARATDRAIQNNAAPIGTQMAGLLASNYNDQNASGQLYRQALEYNDNLRRMTGEFNRGTNQFNAQAYNQAALQNAEIRNRDRQIRAQLGMQAAAQKADMDAGWYNGIYGNVSGLFKGISDLGRENAQHNMIARGIADGVWGVMTPNTNTAYGYLKSNADGGKVTRKKNKKHRKGGLTF